MYVYISFLTHEITISRRHISNSGVFTYQNIDQKKDDCHTIFIDLYIFLHMYIGDLFRFCVKMDKEQDTPQLCIQWKKD